MSKPTTRIETYPPGGRGAPASARLAALGTAALLVTSVLGGCATEPKPTVQLVRASTLVSAAQQSQAQQYAPADLQRARDELSEAQAAESQHRYRHALWLAQRAAADADLASARAASGAARQSAEQVRTSLETLRQQLQPSATPSGETGSGDSGADQGQQ